MRVIAGRYGGRRLRAPRGRTTRPSSDRVREALFSMLGEVHGVVVLDLFAGTGALGIEALSRGAARAVFVERDPAALASLRANLAALDLIEPAIEPAAGALGLEIGGPRPPAETPRPQAEVRRGEARLALRTARERHETYDLIFVDPPYDDARAWERELSVALPPLLAPGARVVVESDRRVPLELSLDAEQERQQRRYGDTTITIHHLSSPPSER